MTALFIDRSGAEITLNRHSIQIAVGGECTNIPCARVERLIVRSPARIDTAVLTRLWSQGAGVLILSGRGAEPAARFLEMPHNDALCRVAQLRLQTPGVTAIGIARDIVSRKLGAQGRTLVEIASHRRGMALDALAWHERMAELRGCLVRTRSLHGVRGVEATATGAYFRALNRAFAPALGFQGFRRQPPADPVNACLSLGETLLTFEAARRAQIAGLDPMLGVLHAPAPGQKALACDLVEPLLPRLDLMVWNCFARRTLRPEHFSRDVRGHCRMGKAGREIFYETMERHMPLWSRWLCRAMRAFTYRLHVPADGNAEFFGQTGPDPLPEEIRYRRGPDHRPGRV